MLIYSVWLFKKQTQIKHITPEENIRILSQWHRAFKKYSFQLDG